MSLVSGAQTEQVVVQTLESTPRGERHWNTCGLTHATGISRMAISRKWLAKRPRFHVHLSPTYGSWINLVERWFAEITNKRIRHGVFRSVKELEAALREYIDVHNQNRKPLVWTKTADPILASTACLAQRPCAVLSA
jgi:hypothetical protein